MEILSKLSQNEDNEDLLTENLQEVLYERIVAMLTVQDIQMIVYTLEVLYQLSEMGEVPSTHIAQIRASIGEILPPPPSIQMGEVPSTHIAQIRASIGEILPPPPRIQMGEVPSTHIAQIRASIGEIHPHTHTHTPPHPPPPIYRWAKCQAHTSLRYGRQ